MSNSLACQCLQTSSPCIVLPLRLNYTDSCLSSSKCKCANLEMTDILQSTTRRNTVHGHYGSCIQWLSGIQPASSLDEGSELLRSNFRHSAACRACGPLDEIGTSSLPRERHRPCKLRALNYKTLLNPCYAWYGHYLHARGLPVVILFFGFSSWTSGRRMCASAQLPVKVNDYFLMKKAYDLYVKFHFSKSVCAYQ